ncbi:hypothetical protein L195_g013375 [Trifolium pratense]|uniref:Uncharacterized protein n=1 Tax=Trifolium pratense TaxID=57577 RepID=A0A2K3PBE6_TRIPR|nr:hypothetical protein L195_g009159 [Trifolium pratense]PNY12607.1 hypothetical protein L195_g009241 [Trifolium pratense]PNY16650.1 hypothetical protein L195_g013375 [Trifolium pratense]
MFHKWWRIWVFGYGRFCEIINIPLLPSLNEDKLIWKHEKSGVYSVQTGYNMVMQSMVGVEKYHMDGEWGGLWSAKCWTAQWESHWIGSTH